jgi:hypothetical protein
MEGVLLENLTVVQPVKKLPAIYGTRRFITVFTSSLDSILSQLNPIHFLIPCFSKIHYILFPPTRRFHTYDNSVQLGPFINVLDNSETRPITAKH